jgi:hypothetical protein
MKKTIVLNDKNYFEIFIGKRVLKSEVFNSTGDIPIYSANVFEPFGYMDKSNINDFSHDYILWSIDGKFEFNIIRRNTKFYITDHCGAIKILDKNILPEYLLHELELQSHVLGFDRTLRSSLANMEKVIVDIPIDKDGDFNIPLQRENIKKYLLLKNLSNDLKNEVNELSQITLSIDLPQKNILILKIEDIFDLSKKTNKSNFTKDFINRNKGNIPVYSASKNPDFVNYGYVKDNLSKIKYYDNCLTWNIDGSVGKAFFRKGKFSLSEKVIPLILKEKWGNLIDEIYVKYILEKKAIERGFAFSNKGGKSRIKDIEIEIPAINRNSELIPDIKRQKDLVYEFEKIYNIKSNLIQYIQGLIDISVEI